MIRARYLLSNEDCRAVFALRRAVFVDELHQAVPARDDEDDFAVYALAFDEAGAPVGTARLAIDVDARFRISRVAVLKAERGRGYGDLLVRMLLQRALDLHAPAVYVDARVEAAPFYARYGFTPVGDARTIEGAPHQLMCAAADEILMDGACARCPGRQS